MVKGIFLSTSKKFNIHLDFIQKSAYVSRQKAITYLGHVLQNDVALIFEINLTVFKCRILQSFFTIFLIFFFFFNKNQNFNKDKNHCKLGSLTKLT